MLYMRLNVARTACVQWNYMDLYQNKENLLFEMHNIPLIYEKVNDACYVNTDQSEL